MDRPPHSELRVQGTVFTAYQGRDSRAKLPNSNRNTGTGCRTYSSAAQHGRKTIFTELGSVRRGTARIGKHGPKIRLQMFQFSWKLFLEMKKKKLNIKKNTSFQNYSIIQNSL